MINKVEINPTILATQWIILLLLIELETKVHTKVRFKTLC